MRPTSTPLNPHTYLTARRLTRCGTANPSKDHCAGSVEPLVPNTTQETNATTRLV
jgi:hypothetical protein